MAQNPQQQTTNDPLADAVKYSKNASITIDNIGVWERQMRSLMLTGGNQKKISDLNKRIIEFMGDASHMLVKAHAALEYAMDHYKKLDPHHPHLELLKQKQIAIGKQEARLDHIRERVLMRQKPLKTDPTMEILKDAPTVSKIDPAYYQKMKDLTESLFDDNGILKTRSLAKAFLPMKPKDQQFFFNTLATHILSHEHAQLNAVKVFEQLPVVPFAAERQQFIAEIRKVNKEMALEILKRIEVPKGELPSIAEAPARLQTPKQKSQEEIDFEQKVLQAVSGGFSQVKKNWKA